MIETLIAGNGLLVRVDTKVVVPWNDHGFSVIGEVSDRNEAYEKILALKPDILITDIRMPGMDDTTLPRRPRQEKISVQSVVLGCFDEFKLVREVMKCGARDYILRLSIDPARTLEVLGEIRQDLASLLEDEPHFSLNADNLRYLSIKKPQNRGFTSDRQIESVSHNAQLTVSLKSYYLMRLTFGPETTKVPDDNHRKMIYNLLNQPCQRYLGNKLSSPDEKGYLTI